jgi:hypothetical protein
LPLAGRCEGHFRMPVPNLAAPDLAPAGPGFRASSSSGRRVAGSGLRPPAPPGVAVAAAVCFPASLTGFLRSGAIRLSKRRRFRKSGFWYGRCRDLGGGGEVGRARAAVSAERGRKCASTASVFGRSSSTLLTMVCSSADLRFIVPYFDRTCCCRKMIHDDQR